MGKRPGNGFRDPRHIDRLLGVRRPAQAHQLGFGEGFTRRLSRCPGCGHELDHEQNCPSCGAFACRNCDRITTPNGGDGALCHGCMMAGKLLVAAGAK